MSAEYTLMTLHVNAAGKGSSTACAVAGAAVAAARAEDCLLREVEAPAGVLLESRQRIERAKRALAGAQAGLIQAAWTDGTLADKADLAEVVSGLLAEAAVSKRPT